MKLHRHLAVTCLPGIVMVFAAACDSDSAAVDASADTSADVVGPPPVSCDPKPGWVALTADIEVERRLLSLAGGGVLALGDAVISKVDVASDGTIAGRHFEDSGVSALRVTP